MSLQSGNSPRPQAALPNAGAGGHAPLLSNPRIQSLVAAAPQRATIALILLGMILGLVVAYVVIPTEFTGASPRHMSQQAIQQWVRMVAVGHSQNISYDDTNALLVLQQIPEPQATVRSLAANLQIPSAERQALDALTKIAGFNELAGTVAPEDPGVAISSLQVAASLVVVALGAVILTIIGRGILSASGGADMLNRDAPAQEQPGADTQSAAPQSYSPYGSVPAASPWTTAPTAPSGTMHPQFGAPVLHTMSNFVKGGSFDESFAIELSSEQGSEFLGECGVSAATQVEGELQSVEFWGFDIQTQETLSRFFAAPAALSDPTLLATLRERVSNPTQDITAAEPGAVLVVESSALIIQAEVKGVVCNYGGGLPNSGIESLQIELMAWYKGAQPAGVPAESYPSAAGSPFGEFAEVKVAPAVGSASPAPPPPASGSSAPPAKRPEDEEEDPFGGTGNFMPYS